jgi:SAM-dependent methyltransferase
VRRDADDILGRTYSEILAARLPAYDDWLYSYCGSTGTPAGVDRYLTYLRDLLAFAHVDLEGLDVVDAGCGFGFTLLAAAALGASTARGVDTSSSMIRTVEAYRPRLPASLAARVEVTVADVSEPPHPDESVDLLLSVEAISHYRRVESFVGEARRVLRRGGTMIISDGNNGANPWIRRKTRGIWDAFEEGEPHPAVPHASELQSYRERRRDWVVRHHPDLPADRIAQATFGHDFAELARVCDAYRETGALPASFNTHDRVPVSPEDGSVIERLFEPYALARELEAAGFDTRVEGYWGGAGGNRWIRLGNRALARLSRLTIFTAKAFRIAARKA